MQFGNLSVSFNKISICKSKLVKTISKYTNLIETNENIMAL